MSSVLAIRSVTSTASSWRPLARCTAARARTTADVGGRLSSRAAASRWRPVAVSSSDTSRASASRPTGMTAGTPGAMHRADLEAGHEPTDEAVLPRRRIGVEHGDQRPARAHRVAAGLAQAEEELGDRRQVVIRAGQVHQLGQPVVGQGGHERPLGPAGHGGRLGHREDRLGSPVALGPGEHAAPDGGQGGRGRLARHVEQEPGRAGADDPTTATSQRHLRPPVDDLTSFPRSIGLRAASSSRSGGFRDLVTPMVLKWAKFRSGAPPPS